MQMGVVQLLSVGSFNTAVVQTLNEKLSKHWNPLSHGWYWGTVFCYDLPGESEHSEANMHWLIRRPPLTSLECYRFVFVRLLMQYRRRRAPHSLTLTLKRTEYMYINNIVKTGKKVRHYLTITTTVVVSVVCRELFSFRKKYLDQTRHQTA